MPIPSPTASTLSFVKRVHDAYAALMDFAVENAEPELGGKLLYVGKLDSDKRAFAVAANIAGAATLAASDNGAALREAQREGVIDFIVNSLDEALRILKNEIRKGEPVAVAVSQAHTVVESEMLERGVLPDLLPVQLANTPAISAFLAHGSHLVHAAASIAEEIFLIWPVPAEFAQRLAAFDALLVEHLPPADQLNRRWLRIAPRYLPPAARQLRSISCDEAAAAKLIARLGEPLMT